MQTPEKACAEIKRVLKQEGLLFAPNFVHVNCKKAARFSRIAGVMGFHAYHKWDISGYCGFLSENGFVVIKSEIIESSFPIAFVIAKNNSGRNGIIH